MNGLSSKEHIVVQPSFQQMNRQLGLKEVCILRISAAVNAENRQLSMPFAEGDVKLIV
jgi:hypothetical protein